MSNYVFNLDIGKVCEKPDMKLVRKYRTFIESVIDGHILCYVPLYTSRLKAINSRIKLLSNRIDSLKSFSCFDLNIVLQKKCILEELKELYVDRERIQSMSDMIDRKIIDHNFRKLVKAAQYLYRWGFLKSYNINKGMISGIWFDGYDKPDRQGYKIFNTIKWEKIYNENKAPYVHDYITKTILEHERDKTQKNTPVAELKIFNGDLQWNKNKNRCKPSANQRSTQYLLYKIRAKRKIPLMREALKY